MIIANGVDSAFEDYEENGDFVFRFYVKAEVESVNSGIVELRKTVLDYLEDSLGAEPKPGNYGINCNCYDVSAGDE